MANSSVKDKDIAIGELHAAEAFLELLNLTDNGAGGKEADHKAYLMTLVLDVVMPKIAAVRNWIDVDAVVSNPPPAA